MTKECPREADVFEAVAFDRLDDVREHLATCAICAEIADVAGALRGEHAVACREANPPSAGIVWWRATIRARAEAARTVSQPISVLQGVAGACGIGLAAGLAGVVWPSLRWVERGGEFLAQLHAQGDEYGTLPALMLQHGLPLLVGIAACLVIAPLAVYVALSDD